MVLWLVINITSPAHLRTINVKYNQQCPRQNLDSILHPSPKSWLPLIISYAHPSFVTRYQSFRVSMDNRKATILSTPTKLRCSSTVVVKQTPLPYISIPCISTPYIGAFSRLALKAINLDGRLARENVQRQPHEQLHKLVVLIFFAKILNHPMARAILFLNSLSDSLKPGNLFFFFARNRKEQSGLPSYQLG